MEHRPVSIFQWFFTQLLQRGFEGLALIRVRACFQSANTVVIE